MIRVLIIFIAGLVAALSLRGLSVTQVAQFTDTDQTIELRYLPNGQKLRTLKLGLQQCNGKFNLVCYHQLFWKALSKRWES